MVNDKKQSHHCHLCWCSTPAVLLRTVKLFPASDSRCSSLKHQRKYKSEKYSRSAQRNTVHSSLKRHKTDSLRSSVCDIGIVQITPAVVNGWRATKVCGLSPSSLGIQWIPCCDQSTRCSNINTIYQSDPGWQDLAGAKMAMKPFVKRVFTIFATNASFLRVITDLQI